MQKWIKGFFDGAFKIAILSLFLCCLLPVRGNAQLVAPTITAQPSDTIVTNSGVATFTVDAFLLVGGINYTWYHNGVKINNGTRIKGADKSTCTISNVGFADGGVYSVKVV